MRDDVSTGLSVPASISMRAAHSNGVLTMTTEAMPRGRPGR
jgi:hypothetical protein